MTNERPREYDTSPEVLADRFAAAATDPAELLSLLREAVTWADVPHEAGDVPPGDWCEFVGRRHFEDQGLAWDTAVFAAELPKFYLAWQRSVGARGVPAGTA